MRRELEHAVDMVAVIVGDFPGGGRHGMARNAQLRQFGEAEALVDQALGAESLAAFTASLPE